MGPFRDFWNHMPYSIFNEEETLFDKMSEEEESKSADEWNWVMKKKTWDNKLTLNNEEKKHWEDWELSDEVKVEGLEDRNRLLDEKLGSLKEEVWLLIIHCLWSLNQILHCE